jgi:MFS family permease
MTSIAAPLEFREHKAIWLVGSGHLMSHFYHLTLPPLFLLIKPVLGISYAELGFVMTVYFFATGITQIPIGMLVDRIGAKPVLVAGLLLHGAAVAVAGMVVSYPVLLVTFFLGGVANSVFHPADFTLLSRNVRETHHGRAFAVHTFTGSIGYALAPIMMLALAGWFGWQAALISAGAAGIIVAVLIMVFGGDLKESEGLGKASADASDQAAEKRADWRIMLTRPMIMFFLFYIAVSAAGTGITTFSIVSFPLLYGVTENMAGTILSVFLFAAIAGSLPGGWLADRARREDLILVACFVIMAASLIAVGTGGLSVWLVIAVMLIAGLMRGLYNASRDILVRRSAPEGSIGTAFAFVTVGYSVGLSIAPVVFGWLLDEGSAASVFYLSAVFALLAIVTVIVPATKSSKP